MGCLEGERGQQVLGETSKQKSLLYRKHHVSSGFNVLRLHRGEPPVILTHPLSSNWLGHDKTDGEIAKEDGFQLAFAFIEFLSIEAF